MAISPKKKSPPSSDKLDRIEHCRIISLALKCLYRVPAIVLFLILIFLWSSSTTIISGNIVHVCVSSRRLGDLYCLSAGRGNTPSFDIPIANVSADVAMNVSDDVAPIVSDAVAQSVPDDVVPNVSDDVAPSVSDDVAPSVSDDVAPSVSDDVTRNASAYLTTKAVRSMEDQLRLHRSWAANGSSSRASGCDARGIYVYDLPSKFNKDLLGQCAEMVPWMDFCKYLSNGALGEEIRELGEGWYKTHQYALEPIFHSRVLKHRCRVFDPNKAKLFYVPYYGGMDILRWHFKNVSNDVKDSLGLELLSWLGSKGSWNRMNGSDHVFVLGKISWDFRRKPNYSWGTRFLDLPEMQNPLKLLIERQPWHYHDIGIPHPTYFHPRSDENIFSWQRKIISSYRKNLVSFAGAARPGDPDSIRSTLIKQCTSVELSKCRFLDCNSHKCGQPEAIINIFTKSEFCLQPPGDSPTRKSIFDSLVSGCIPVIFNPLSAYYQYPWHLPKDYTKYSVFIDQEDVRNMKVNVVERLMKITIKERDDMRRYIVYELLPGLVYSDPNSKLDKFQDSFDITINNLLESVNRL